MESLLTLFFLFVVVFSSIDGQESTEEKNSEGRRVLVFGGNGFIGSEVVKELIEKGYDITLVNRGNWYFDSKERIQPYVNYHFTCDRDKAFKLECPELLTSGYYDIVIDFSSYTSKQIQQVTDILRDRVGLYIYISTDSIYEVCQKDHVAASREEDAVRPKSAKKRMQLRKSETYGHEKLACEEVLRKQRQAGGFPYVALRLPDVIGPRDGSFRFWTYQIWIQTHKAIKEKVHLPLGVSDTKFSLIHVEDAAKAVQKIIEAGPKAYDLAINFAFEEYFTLKSLLTDIGRQLKVEDIDFLTDEDQAWYTYPTVTKGPLDISRARLLLDWEPIPWTRALKSLTTFFEDAMTDKAFASEREMVLADVIENLVPEEKYSSFLKALKRIYGEDVFDGLDMDIGFAKDAMELEGSSVNNTSDAHTIASNGQNSTTTADEVVHDDEEMESTDTAKSTKNAEKEEL
ncbi:uncharacterized protein LOC116301551 [Actinia tenebrosa]|uniref:Uncharacterized protein LOC116301551 n=1 Tax=Actinia tenebrosa TaxID=6105 RepID=A0A6P8II58_ACTTE|nr:uncharacterized protein LOC116301551 [Actinia tenebrosa]